MIKLLFTILSFVAAIPFSNTGDTFPTNSGTVDRAGLTAWVAWGAIFSDNANDATCNAASGSDYLIALGFGFAIPSGSTINGILVKAEVSEHSGGTEPLLARLVSSGTTDPPTFVGNEKTTSNEGSISGTTKAIYTYGSTSDLWGGTITEATVESANFGVALWFATSHDVRIDYVTMAIEYTTPAGHRAIIISKK